jgi:hypothetical protein
LARAINTSDKETPSEAAVLRLTECLRNAAPIRARKIALRAALLAAEGKPVVLLAIDFEWD